MNRRKAIFSILLVGGGAAATYSGFRWYHIRKTPDLKFLDEHKALIADLAELIIPRTDTPGAKDNAVHEFIIKMIKECSDRKAQNNFIDGLKDVNDRAISKHNEVFAKLTLQQQQEILQHFREKGKNFSGILGKAKNKFLGKSFYTILKEYSTIGFCTSRSGATETLAYDFIPGKYNACIPLAPGQRSWATK